MPAVDEIREQAARLAKPDLAVAGTPVGDSVRARLKTTLDQKGGRAAMEDARNRVQTGVSDARKTEIVNNSILPDDGTAEWAAVSGDMANAQVGIDAAIDIVNPYVLQGIDALRAADPTAADVVSDKLMARVGAAAWLNPVYGALPTHADRRTFAENLLKDTYFQQAVNRKLQERAEPITHDERITRFNELVAGGALSDHQTWMNAATQLAQEQQQSLNNVLEDATDEYLLSVLNDTDNFMTTQAANIDQDIQKTLKEGDKTQTKARIQGMEGAWNKRNTGRERVDQDFQRLLEGGGDRVVERYIADPAERARIMGDPELRKQIEDHIIMSLIAKKFGRGNLSERELMALADAPWWAARGEDGVQRVSQLIERYGERRGLISEASAQNILGGEWWKRIARSQWARIMLLLLVGIAAPPVLAVALPAYAGVVKDAFSAGTSGIR